MCLSAAYWARLEKVVYSADKNTAAKAGFSDAFIYDELALTPDKRSLTMERIMQEEGNKPFMKWEKNKNKVRY
jgi:tRNA(Arg) A34 adenosine deaminase TadA